MYLMNHMKVRSMKCRQRSLKTSYRVILTLASNRSGKIQYTGLSQRVTVTGLVDSGKVNCLTALIRKWLPVKNSRTERFVST